jgi:hypothetical protein
VPPNPTGLGFYREQLALALRSMPHNGGVPRKLLRDAGFTADWCTRAIQLEWSAKEKTTLWPGMPREERAAAAKACANTRHIRTFDRVWRAARELLEREGDVVSGRLFMANHRTENGVVRVVRTRGVRAVAEQYAVRTFIMDATLPARSILESWFPDVVITGQIEVTMQHVHVRQITGSPNTKKKLGGAGRNLRAVRRYVLQRFVEADAGALSGVEPAKATVRANRSTWYDRVIRGVRMRDGTGVAVTCDQHPDDLAEAIRYQICEAELVQAIGRGRGVNRTAETPLDVDILADVVLPVTVDEVQEWEAPGHEVEMVAEGIWLESPADMARAWPDVWATAKAARDWLCANSVEFPLIVYVYQGKIDTVRFQHVRYQLAGPKQHWHVAWVDPAVVPDARSWLEARLGPLSGYEVTTVLITMRSGELAVGPPDFATPPVTVRPGPGQEKLSWSTPVVEEVSLPPEEVAALWTLPPAVEGGQAVVPPSLAPFVTPDEFAAFLALPPVVEGAAE